jgi:membrane-associated phospholipid phosphatase
VSPLLESGLELIRWLQANYPQLGDAMNVVSQLGRFEFFLAVVPLLYWCIHKQFGKQLAYLLALTNVVNAVFKHALRQPRPYWLDDTIGLSTEESYGIPSNHAQTATVVYLFAAAWARRRWAWILAILFIVLMGFSRVYLGVHFWYDAAAGLLIGLVVLGGYLLWLRFFQNSFRNRILGQRLLFALVIPLTFTAIYVLIRVLTGAPGSSVEWGSYIPTAELTSIEDVTSGLAMLLGMGIGFIMEATRVHFVVNGPLLKRAARYILGIVVTVAIWRGLAMVLPGEPLWLALPLRFARYWLASMWVAYYAPAVFVRLRLADASPEPEVQLTISNGSIMRG